MKQQLPFDTEEWMLENDLSTGFIQQGSPDWMIEDTSGGGTISYTEHHGGRVTLDSGANAVGDHAMLNLSDGSAAIRLHTAKVDCVVLSLHIGHIAGENSRQQRPSVQFGFQNSNNRALVELENETVTVANDNDGVSETANVTTDAPWWDYVPYTMVWNLLDGEIYVVGAGIKSPTLGDTLAADTWYNVWMPRVETLDTTYDNSVDVRSITLQTYQFW